MANSREIQELVIKTNFEEIDKAKKSYEELNKAAIAADRTLSKISSDIIKRLQGERKISLESILKLNNKVLMAKASIPVDSMFRNGLPRSEHSWGEAGSYKTSSNKIDFDYISELQKKMQAVEKAL